MGKRSTNGEGAFFDEPRQPWDRLPGEGDKAWQCFQLYRDANLPDGIGTRTQRAVSAIAYPNATHSAKRARKEIGVWSARWRWLERCAAYDAHLDRQKQDEFRKALRRDTEINIATYRAMRNKGGRVIAEREAGGIETRDAIRMVDVGITGLRREAGLATEIAGTERDNAFAEWLTRGGDPDDEDEPNGGND